LFEEAGFFHAGALGEAGVRRSGTEASYSNAGAVQFVGQRF
jgi:hypothetical protein